VINFKPMLTVWRRHQVGCPYRSKGRLHTKCSCPIWCDGEIDGKRVRKSMGTRDWALAMRNLGRIEDPTYGLQRCLQPGCQEMVEQGRCERHTRDIARAIAAYHDAHQMPPTGPSVIGVAACDFWRSSLRLAGSAQSIRLTWRRSLLFAECES
jgi:hypothetical protein